MKQKFQEGDRVVISKKHKDRYNCITCVGTVIDIDRTIVGDVIIPVDDIHFHAPSTRKMYYVLWDDKSFVGPYYSYELEKYVEPEVESKKDKHMNNKRKFQVGDHAIVKTGYHKGEEVVVSEVTTFRNRCAYIADNKRFGSGLYYSYDLDHTPEKDKPIQMVDWPLGDGPKGHPKPKKDKPIQMVELHKQDTVDKNTEIKSRIAHWNDVCNEYLKAFCKKHEYPYEPDMWVGSDPGTIVMVSDMFVSMDNIRYDIDHEVPESYFEKWYWKSLDVHELTDGAENYMNYENYCKGCPDYWTEERMNSIREAKKRLAEAKESLEEEIENIKHNKYNKKLF